MSDNEILELLSIQTEYEVDEDGYYYADSFPTRPSAADLDYLGEKDEWN